MAMYRNTNSTFGSHYAHPSYSLAKRPSSIINQKPSGLENLKNTCYISAVLQLLFLILPESLSKTKGNITGLFFKLKSTKDTRDYKQFKKAAEKLIYIVQGYEQQDAQQFLISLLDVFDKENSQISKPSKVDLDYKINQNISQNYQNFLKQMRKIENSPIVNLFSGESIRQFRCMTDQNHIKLKFERFQVMSLSFPSPTQPSRFSYSSSHSTITLQELIKMEMNKEKISDLDCQQCHRKSDFEKQTFFYRLPNYLILHLARFKKGYLNNEKINTTVEFDENIIIRQQINQLGVKYRLVGTVNHFGTLNQGHYFAQVKHTDGYWYQINDEVVRGSSMSSQGNRSKYVYILFYERLR